MTSAPAERFGFRDRGSCATARSPTSGLRPRAVRANATYDEPRRFPIGIESVIVNGALVVDGGAHTGATPGRGIRLGKD